MYFYPSINEKGVDPSSYAKSVSWGTWFKQTTRKAELLSKQCDKRMLIIWWLLFVHNKRLHPYPIKHVFFNHASITIIHCLIHLCKHLQIVKHRSHIQSPPNPVQIKNGKRRKSSLRVALPDRVGICEKWSFSTDQSAWATFKNEERGGNIYPTTYRSTVGSCPGGIS